MAKICNPIISHSAILALVLLTVFHIGDAIICYQCNSEYDPRCGDPFDSYTLGTVNCSFQPRPEHLGNAEPTLCRKTLQKIYGKTRVVRGCGFLTDSRDDGDCVQRSGTHDVLAWYCACTTDLCNAANAKLPMSVIGTTTTALTAILFRHKLAGF
ncbi:uncharacterized protein LOC105693673 [Athalia rosae]|uniref:uncharacterized protein LOC105693673 n=1 Tax=Athalia rosae TaxID=37344 RepID=UPI00062671F3|nr:uncharacterized protein LOC105693673 [Athalia rosae]XP_012269178.1 uncharacterized protein LOC105693673 [Athalia rosae]XP_048513266.1 uncharacterized protein LOC105693673 [Athalia rosae]